MSNKNLVILAVVAAVMVIWAAVQSRVSNEVSVSSDVPTYLFQGLDPADVAEIVIGKGDEAIRLKREGRGFVVLNKANYPAKIKEVNGMLRECMEIKFSELFTENSANHEDLGVTEEKGTTIVKFMKADPNAPLLAGMIIGKQRELGQGSYIRLLPGDKVFVSPENPYIQSSITSFYEQELISVEEADIESVAVKGPSEQYVLKKEEDGGEVVLEDLPAGKQLKQSDADTVFSALTSLRCDDVQKGAEGLDFNRQYVCRAKDSTVYTVNIAQKDGDTYVTCQAEYTGELPQKGKEVESDEVLKEKEAKLLAADKANKLASRHRGWVYKLTEWKAKSLVKPLADLLEDEEKPEADPNDVAPVTAGGTVEPDKSVAEVVDAVEAVAVAEPNEPADADANAAKP